jgi:hypothetical protein
LGVAALASHADERSVPPGFEREASFLRLLKMSSEPTGSFDPNDAPAWNLGELEKYFPKGGVDFVDVNHVLEGHVGREEILTQLKSRRGKVFEAFAHLSHIVSIPYKQYSALQFTRMAGGTSLVRVSDWYALTFRDSGSGACIIRFEYTMPEVE